jgi:CRP/FNR family transcriptional regulator
LFHVGQPLHYVYLIKTGSVKTYTPAQDGKEHVTGFRFAGDMLGLDGLYSSQYQCTAVALEATSVCALPVVGMLDVYRALPEVSERVLRMMSKELIRYQELLVLIGSKSAEQRLASFLLSLSQRYSEHGHSDTRFSLTMSRRDIADYLGLALETVSRLFSRFQAAGALSVHGKRLEIHSPSLLKELAQGYASPTATLERKRSDDPAQGGLQRVKATDRA